MFSLAPRLAITLNALGLYAIAAILLAAFAFQFIWQELPCPLCLLQRAGFAAIAVGPILTIRYGPRPSHYALSIFAAIAGAAFAARQILLHIAPGDPGYGSAILGYHYYTWALICFVIAIALCALVLVFDEQFRAEGAAPAPTTFAKTAVWLVIGVTFLNFAAGLAECGLAACPDNPDRYQLLYRPSPS